jgi:hypothetical protein
MPIPAVVYIWNNPISSWKAPRRTNLVLGVKLRVHRAELAGTLGAPTSYGPVSYPTLADAKSALGAPADANYVTWSFGSQMLEQVFASLGANDILVLPERAEPYYIDSSNGFMAAGVSGVDGTGTNGLKDGSIVPIVSNSRLWFEMCRARRGILGMGPGAVIAPSASSWTAPRQPILQNEPAGSQFQKAYFSAGGSMNLSGVQGGLIGNGHANPFFANFILQGRDFGGWAYNALSFGGSSAATIKRVTLDQAWRSHAGVPNGEAGALGFSGGSYLIESCDLIAPSTGYAGGSPIMWNQNTGDTVRHVRSYGSKSGMWTYWRCGGTNTWEDVSIQGNQVILNIEENLSGFRLDWTGGSGTMTYTGNKFHMGCNPSGGAPTVALHGVSLATNAYTPGAFTMNIYTTAGVARRSLITCDTLPVSCVPASSWIP